MGSECPIDLYVLVSLDRDHSMFRPCHPIWFSLYAATCNYIAPVERSMHHTLHTYDSRKNLFASVWCEYLLARASSWGMADERADGSDYLLL